VARALVILVALAATARAEPPTDAALVWQAPNSCPEVTEIRARIERRLGRPMEQAVHGIAVEIALEDRRFVARIDLRAVTVENEVRVLTSARCDELADAVAVVIARIAAEHGGPEEVRAAPRIALAVAPPEARSRWGGGLRLEGVSGIGALPRIGLGGELAAYVQRDTAYVELSATRWMPSARFLHAGAPGRVDVRIDAAMLRVGYRSRRLPLRGWLSGEVGSVRGEGVALDDMQAGDGRWIALGGGFGVAWSMTRRARLVGVLETLVPLERARFLLSDGGLVFRPDAITVRTGLGIEVGW